MIEDTSFNIGLLRGDDDARVLLDLIESERRPGKLASVTVLKLYEGLVRSNAAEDRRNAVTSVLETKQTVAATAPITRRAGKLSGSLYTRGEPIDREDCIVAATALLNDEPVVARNAGHFDRVDGLEVRTY